MRTLVLGLGNILLRGQASVFIHFQVLIKLLELSVVLLQNPIKT